MVRPSNTGNLFKINDWSNFVLFRWRFLFGIIMRWEGRELLKLPFRCYHDPGNNKAVSLLLKSELRESG